MTGLVATGAGCRFEAAAALRCLSWLTFQVSLCPQDVMAFQKTRMTCQPVATVASIRVRNSRTTYMCRPARGRLLQIRGRTSKGIRVVKVRRKGATRESTDHFKTWRRLRPDRPRSNKDPMLSAALASSRLACLAMPCQVWKDAASARQPRQVQSLHRSLSQQAMRQRLCFSLVRPYITEECAHLCRAQEVTSP